MIFTELKRILTKSPVLVLLLFIVPVFATSAIYTGIQQPATLPNVTAEQLGALETRLETLKGMIYSGDDDYTDALHLAFDSFTITWNEFFTFELVPNNPASLIQYQNYYANVNESYITLDRVAKETFSSVSKVLMTENNYNKLCDWMDETAKYIDFDSSFNAAALVADQLTERKLGLGLAWDKYAHQSNEKTLHEIYRIVSGADAITFTDDQKHALRVIYADEIQPYVLAFGGPYEQAQVLEIACEYLELHIKVAQSQNTNGITKFQGFKNWNLSQVRDRLAVLGVLVAENKTMTDYSAPYTFGKVLNENIGTTIYDFIFNNLEFVTIPLIVLACFIVVFCIYDDIKNNTVITALISPRSRRKIFSAKLLACAITIAIVITLFSLLFCVAAFVINGGATAAPAVLTAFGGKALIVPPGFLLFIYLLSLFFKILFFASITALLCINSRSRKEVLIKSVIIVAFIMVLNTIFTIVLPFAFYQYLPLVALDFAGFFGIKFMLSRQLASIFIWFSLPIMLIIWFVIISTAAIKFEKRDF